MAWTKPKYSRSQVNRAGRLLVADIDKSSAANSKEWDQALAVINNWRSSHGYPLYVMGKTLLRRARKVDKRALVAQRLKRLDSIALKLRRFDRMQLARMQDIAGCRAILSDVKQINELTNIYIGGIKKNIGSRQEFIEPYNYIDEPKADGYRSYHLVFKYRSDSERRSIYNGLRIELQLRSRLQHAWATAVETVSTFTDQALKSNIGEDSWKRFFVLMGTVIARWEKTKDVSDTPSTETELREELISLCQELQVEDMLLGWSTALKITEPDEEAREYLMILDTNQKHIRVQPFDKNEALEASEQYLEIEKETRDNPSVQAVLVSVDSLSALRTAYPNYYLDTTAFLDMVRKATDGRSTARSRKRS
ncbi:MAG: RelA/SpoT domain-containing protein [Gammaproteobacteria bacterium]|nr:RelA/SpoT domain-containing protein [Gammaproteobacteria bacterium]